eukprot:CAMPEP_0183410598 /NCGR_PEP_ID=MMETSP0370-20130417/19689_1 /TAXON_ID=268820 /ORGANISM="Peridinium aciculiferum, Strain PAER-2" /LENGTH=222 /DNA_ID=CAMNT_0025593453 /DNA_START=48 /DNA_END=716 /DNA_ORIENTATION=-
MAVASTCPSPVRASQHPRRCALVGAGLGLVLAAVASQASSRGCFSALGSALAGSATRELRSGGARSGSGSRAGGVVAGRASESEGEVGASEAPGPSGDALPWVKNAVGGPLERCSLDPLTGWYRDGYCRTDESDGGRHLVCVQTTEEFLMHQRKIGNDLSTPAPQYGFPGLRPGDSWCVCASRWADAVISGVPAPLKAKASHHKALDFAPEETILRHAMDMA